MQDWDEWRWILQLGPHLLAAAAHQNNHLNSVHGGSEQELSSSDAQQFLQNSKRRRQEYVHQTLIHKTVRAGESSKITGIMIIQQPKSDIVLPRIIGFDLTGNLDGEKVLDDDYAAPAETPPRKEENLGGPKHDDELIENNDDLDENDHDEGHHSSRPGCAICLKNYSVGDKICWSRNPECSHHFHRDCVELWLLRNDMCPFCRKPYLGMEQAADDHEMEEQRPRVPAPLGADEMENLERGVTNNTHRRPPRNENLMDDAEFVELIAGIERLYRNAHNRIFMQTEFQVGMHMARSRAEDPQESYPNEDHDEEDLPPATTILSSSSTIQLPSRVEPDTSTELDNDLSGIDDNVSSAPSNSDGLQSTTSPDADDGEIITTSTIGRSNGSTRDPNSPPEESTS